MLSRTPDSCFAQSVICICLIGAYYYGPPSFSRILFTSHIDTLLQTMRREKNAIEHSLEEIFYLYK